MTRVVGQCCLLYGADFLEYALRSIVDHVDALHVCYTPQPSHGTPTTLPCPDTWETLAAIATGVSYKVQWHQGVYRSESEHRAEIYRLEPDADVIVVVDSDEVWTPSGLTDALYFAALSDTRFGRVPMWHYWRSFQRGFTKDPACPIRIIKPKMKEGEFLAAGRPVAVAERVIHHFGYAQRSDIVRYKMGIHGHRNEFRRDVNWFDDVFMANRQTDCHPVGSEYWNAEAIPDSAIPEILAEHPYRHLEVIP